MMRSCDCLRRRLGRTSSACRARRGSSSSASPSSWRCRPCCQSRRRSAAASARIASMAIVCRLFLIKKPPTSRLSRPFAETWTLVRQYDQSVLPTRDDVERARVTIGDRLARTPLLSSRTIGARLKCELFQRTGSFKVRGALNKISSLGDEERARGVIAISAGNHAQAVAFAAARRGHRRARRHVAGRVRAEDRRDARLRRDGRPRGDRSGGGVRAPRARCIEETGRTLVHPFDDPLVIAGAGTVGLEIEEDAPDADAVIVPVGGGGLISGIQTAIGDRVRVIAVEPETSPALHAGLERGAADPGRADVDRRRPERAVRRRSAARDLQPGSSVCSSRRRRSSTPFASSTSGRNSPASRPARWPPRPG